MADAQDSKSCGGDLVWVQVPPSALEKKDSDENLDPFFVADESLESRVQGLRSATVGAGQTSTGRFAPHHPHKSLGFPRLFLLSKKYHTRFHKNA